MATLARGEMYRSKIWRHPDTRSEFLPMQITKVGPNAVYYRPVYGRHDDGSLWVGASAWFPPADASKYLGERVQLTEIGGH